jgi:hypothetical protein
LSISSKASRCQKVTWATKPSGCAFFRSDRTSLRARSRSKWARATVWKQESQNHWNGYVPIDGHTKS